MISLRFWKQREARDLHETTPSTPRADGDDWAFLRSRPDFDVDEMAAVRGNRASEAVLEPDLAWATPAADLLDDRFSPGHDADGPLLLEVWVGAERRLTRVARNATLGRAGGDGPGLEIGIEGDAGVELCHAGIRAGQDGYKLRDLDSRSGTRHNGRRLEAGEEVGLSLGDEIEIGNVTLLRVLDPSALDEWTGEDAGLAEMALDVARPAASPDPYDLPASIPQRAADVLELALEAGEADGLLNGPRPAGSWDAERAPRQFSPRARPNDSARSRRSWELHDR